MAKKNHDFRLKGKLFEWATFVYLSLKGYRVLDMNVRGYGGEIDLLAKKKASLVLVEVKYRKDKISAHYAIHPRQKERLMQHGRSLLKYYPGCDIRLDVALFYAKFPFFEYIEGKIGVFNSC